MMNAQFTFASVIRIAAFLLLIVRPIFAQETPEAQTINLDTALRLALERNINLKQSANDVAVNNATLSQQRANLFPNLNLSAGPTLRFGRAFDQTTADLTDEQSRALSLGISSSINIFNGFADINSVKEARFSLGASENTYERTKQGILYQTASQYLKIFLNQELIEVEVETLNAQHEQLVSIRAEYEAGNRAIADVLQQQASIAQTEQRLIAARRELDISILQLKQTLHLNPLLEVDFEAPSEALFATVMPEYDTRALMQQAMESREDVKAQHLRVEAADVGVSVAHAGYYPSITLNASMGTNYSSQNSLFGFSDQLYDLNPNGSIGFSVSIPIFNRLQTKTNVDHARMTASNEVLALETIEQEIAYEVLQAMLDYDAAKAQQQAAERQFDAAQESLQAAEARYDVGASTLLEVTQARSVLVEAAVSRIQAEYTLLLNQLEIAYSAGQIEQMLSRLL